MKKIEAVRLYQLLSGAKFDGVTKKEDRFALLDCLLTLGKLFDEYADAEKKAQETISVEKDRMEYMNKIAFSDYDVPLPAISKDSMFELIDSNKSNMTLGAVNLMSKIVEK